jgi:hypothetical protein
MFQYCSEKLGCRPDYEAFLNSKFSFGNITETQTKKQPDDFRSVGNLSHKMDLCFRPESESESESESEPESVSESESEPESESESESEDQHQFDFLVGARSFVTAGALDV